MKKTRILLSLALTLALLLSVGVSAFATAPKYESTKKFVDAIANEEGATYMVRDIITENDKEYEEVIVTLKSDALLSGEGAAGVYFSEDGSEVLVAAPVIEKIDQEYLADVLTAINDWNAAALGCTGVRLYVDTNDYSIMGRLDLFTTMDSVAQVVPYAVGVFLGFTDQAASYLADYAA